MSESNPSKKPIEQAIISIDSLISDMQEIKNDISHIKQYIRKMEIRKEIEEQEAQRQENEYVHSDKSWFGW
jgi:uncharacterized protein (DUF3084 family)